MTGHITRYTCKAGGKASSSFNGHRHLDREGEIEAERLVMHGAELVSLVGVAGGR